MSALMRGLRSKDRALAILGTLALSACSAKVNGTATLTTGTGASTSAPASLAYSGAVAWVENVAVPTITLSNSGGGDHLLLDFSQYSRRRYGWAHVKRRLLRHGHRDRSSLDQDLYRDRVELRRLQYCNPEPHHQRHWLSHL